MEKCSLRRAKYRSRKFASIVFSNLSEDVDVIETNLSAGSWKFWIVRESRPTYCEMFNLFVEYSGS